jgi:hypothetical protein
MSIAPVRSRARAVLALPVAVAIVAVAPGVAHAVDTRCGDRTIDRSLPDPTAGDPAIVVLGVAGFDQPSEGDDVIFGSDATADVINGLGGNDVICGFAGNDVIVAGAGNDTVIGGDGDDRTTGGSGSDEIAGGPGIDTADYADALGSIVADLSTGDVTGGAGPDLVQETENVVGGAFGDEMIGNPAVNVLSGGAGDDTIDGGLGNDIENGGDGDDTFTQSGEIPNGADAMGGGPGVDSVDYSTRGTLASFTNDGVANDGEAGEGDNAAPDVEAASLGARAPAPGAVTSDFTSPVLTAFKTSDPLFSPNGDGRRDRFRAAGRFSESVQWTFDIRHGTSVIFADGGQGLSMEAIWDGRTVAATQAVSGVYSWRVTAKDAAGNQVIRNGSVTIDLKRPAVRQLSASRVQFDLRRRRSARLRYSASEEATVRVRIVRGSTVHRLRTRTLEEPGAFAVTWNGRLARNRRARAGRYRVLVAVRDIAGNETLRRATITVRR